MQRALTHSDAISEEDITEDKVKTFVKIRVIEVLSELIRDVMIEESYLTPISQTPFTQGSI